MKNEQEEIVHTKQTIEYTLQIRAITTIEKPAEG